jgi:two-component system, chemotaxis family, CheB/CheR fusion protein
VEKEVRGVGGRIFLARMLPYSVPSSTRRGAVATFVDVTSFHVAERLQDVLDALAEHVAVVEPDGTIRLVNAAWRRFAEENGDAPMHRSGPGSNYFAACHAGDGEDGRIAAQAVEGVRAVLDGRLPRFALEYPCHSPTERRWFVMHATPIRDRLGGAVVSHVNVTAWKVKDL